MSQIKSKKKNMILDSIVPTTKQEKHEKENENEQNFQLNFEEEVIEEGGNKKISQFTNIMQAGSSKNGEIETNYDSNLDGDSISRQNHYVPQNLFENYQQNSEVAKNNYEKPKLVIKPPSLTNNNVNHQQFKKKQIKPKIVATNLKKKQQPGIFQNPFEDDIGEVGEWTGKSANINNRDEFDDYDYNEKEENQFESIFEDKEQHQTQNQSEFKPKQQNIQPIKPKSEEDEPEVTSGIKGLQLPKPLPPSKKEHGGAGFQRKVNSGNNKPFRNNLVEKAKALAEQQNSQENNKLNGNSQQLQQVNESDEDDTDINFDDYYKNQQEPEGIKKQINPQIVNNIPGGVVQDVGEEWEMVSKVNLIQIENQKKQAEREEGSRQEISYIDAWTQIKELNLDKEKQQIVQETQKSVLEKLFSCGKQLPPNLLQERNQIFGYAKVKYSEEDPLHFKMLKSIFSKVTDTQNCPRFGQHWELIGFQGRDPATDLRGVGMFGVLQLLAFSCTHKELFKYIHKYSIKLENNFPLCACLLGITKLVLEALRETKLNSLATQNRSVINVVNNIYFGAFLRLFVIYKHGQCTIMNYNDILIKVTAFTKASPSKVIQDFVAALDKINKLGLDTAFNEQIQLSQ